MENRNLKIGVIGLGLIGGSILKSLKEISKQKGYELFAVSKSSYKKAKDFADITSNDINIVKDCNIIFVCTKMSETLCMLDRLENIADKSCIVTDVCSLKRFVNNKKYSFNFIASHPMAGTEFSGFENSFSGLFSGAKWILNKKNEILEKLIKEMGAKPLILNEDDHDKFTCLISHLPMLLSCALLNTVVKEAPDALKIASSGFRDATRLSLTNADLAFEMLELNFDNFNIYIDKFIENLKEFKSMDKEKFLNTLKPIQKIRSSMYDNNGKNRLSDEGKNNIN